MRRRPNVHFNTLKVAKKNPRSFCRSPAFGLAPIEDSDSQFTFCALMNSGEDEVVAAAISARKEARTARNNDEVLMKRQNPD